MASFRFPPPESFNFERPSEWPEWKERFARYKLASELHKDADEVQISALIYSMGRQGEHIFKSLVFAEQGDEGKYDKVLEKFDGYFVPKRNAIHERARFHLRVQNAGESVEAFVRGLHELAEHCNFDKKSEQIRNRLVIGICDKGVSEKLQLRADLTLETAIQVARNSELVKSQVNDLQTHNRDAVVKPKRQQSQHTPRRKPVSRDSTYHKEHPCDKCNRHHSGRPCPASGRRCRKCGKMNHYEACCKSTKKTTSSVNEVKDEQDVFFMGAVTECTTTDAWFTTLKVGGRNVKFKIDTGADISIMTEAPYNSLHHKPKLGPNRSILKTPSGILNSKGKFIAITKYRQSVYSFPVIVIPGRKTTNNLLARSVAHTCTMGLVEKLDSVSEDFGTMKGDHVKITLRDDAEPYCVITARRIPFPLLPKVIYIY